MRHQLFRRKAETRERQHRKSPFIQRERWSIYTGDGSPESKLSKYLSRLLDANAAGRR